MSSSKEQVTLPLTEYDISEIVQMDVEELEKAVLITPEADIRRLYKKITGKTLPRDKKIRSLFQ